VTYAGQPEIEAEWGARHRADVHLLDARSPAEFTGELGHLEEAQRVPLDELRGRIGEVPTDKPVFVICQTGRRSALAAQLLASAGVPRAANLAVAWWPFVTRGLWPLLTAALLARVVACVSGGLVICCLPSYAPTPLLLSRVVAAGWL
jgi:rhodanese-related sulfurtransferase